jgi:hypothetical protein
MLIGLLPQKLPPNTKLVLVHALDPAGFAEVKADPAWPAAALGAVATEDLSHVRHLGLLPLGRRDDGLKPILQAHLPNASFTALPQVPTAANACAAVAAFFAAD